MKMRKFLQNKLWRDKAVEGMEQMGSKINWERLDDAQYDKQLRLKLIEESNEVVGAQSPDEVRDELADVLEVMQTLCTLHNITWDDIVRAQDQKRIDRGGFEGRKFVTTAEHPVGGYGEKYCLKDPEKYPEVL